MNRTRSVLVAPALAALAIASSCSREEPRPARTAVLDERPDVVLVTVDTLRADHLGCYGYFRDTSPHLDELARESLLFERAIATMGTTLPSHLSLMTGLYPSQHGFVANEGAMKARFTSVPGRRAFADVLRDAGYQTAAFVSGPTVSSPTGISAGFDVFDEHEMKDPKNIFDQSRRAGATNERVFEWLERASDRPLFLWVHYWDPHEPNTPPEPYASMFRPDARLDALIDERRIEPAKLASGLELRDLLRCFAPEALRGATEHSVIPAPTIDRDAVRGLLGRYDGDVRYMDDRLGELLAKLRARPRWNHTIVVVTADHGQGLGQHDWLEHGRIQLEETHVPLVVHFPPGLVPQPQRRSEVVSLVDVLPTVAARLPLPQVEGFLEQAAGSDLLSGRFDRSYAFTQRSLRDREWGPGDSGDVLQFALTLDGWRYYHRSEGADQLFQLSSDPGELVDVAAQHPDLTAKLRRVVRQVLAERPWSGGEDASGEGAGIDFADMLKTLGYTGDD